MKWIALGILLSAATGCGLANSRYINYDFARDTEKTTPVGSPMITWSNVYKNDVYGNELSNFEQTLTYSGKDGSVIKVFYREAERAPQGWGMMARPAFTQELTYDIATNPVVAFRDTRIEIREATSTAIRFVVLDSPSYAHPSGYSENDSDVRPRSKKEGPKASLPTGEPPASARPSPAPIPAVVQTFWGTNALLLYTGGCPGFEGINLGTAARFTTVAEAIGAGFRWAPGCDPTDNLRAPADVPTATETPAVSPPASAAPQSTNATP